MKKPLKLSVFTLVFAHSLALAKGGSSSGGSRGSSGSSRSYRATVGGGGGWGGRTYGGVTSWGSGKNWGYSSRATGRLGGIFDRWRNTGKSFFSAPPQTSSLVKTRSQYNRFNAYSQPSQSRMQSDSWFKWWLYYSLFFHHSSPASAGSAYKDYSASDVRVIGDNKDFNVDNDQPGSDEINGLPTAVEFTLRLMNQPELMEGFELKIVPYDQQEVDVLKAEELKRIKEENQKLAAKIETLKAGQLDLVKLRDGTLRSLEDQEEDMNEELAALTVWAKVGELFTSEVHKKFEPLTEALKEELTNYDQEIAKTESELAATTLTSETDEAAELKVAAAHPEWLWVKTDSTILAHNSESLLVCGSDQPAVTYKPLSKDSRLLPFGAWESDLELEGKNKTTNEYTISACLDGRGLPVKLVAKAKADGFKAYVTTAAYDDSKAEEPAITDLRIERFSEDPHSLGVVSQRVEDRRVEKADDGKVKIIYEFQKKTGETINLEQDLVPPQNQP